jgi:hypothetical protein
MWICPKGATSIQSYSNTTVDLGQDHPQIRSTSNDYTFDTAISQLVLSCSINAQAAEPEKPNWLLGHATKIPTQYTNQESGYFSIVEGQNGRVYIGAAKYGVDAYLIEFDPKKDAMNMVMDVHKVMGSDAKGFAAQAKLHTRNNVGASGKIYVGSKQGYPEKD